MFARHSSPICPTTPDSSKDVRVPETSEIGIGRHSDQIINRQILVR